MNHRSQLAIAILVLAVCGSSPPTGSRVTASPAVEAEPYEVTSPEKQNLNLNPFYKKCVVVDGYPIVASERVNDYALKEAAFLVDQMLAKRPDLRRAMIAGGSRLVVMAHNEFTSQIPEYKKLTLEKPAEFWDARARGLGGSREDPICSCAEENLLAFEGDPYASENIMIHEFAHNIHLVGLTRVDPSFETRLEKQYKAAIAAGLWKGKYASVNETEYFAEGVQSWFDNNRPPDHDHNHVDTRAELKEYDPGLAAICQEVFGETELKYTKPTMRLTGHMRGYDPTSAPKFEWPKRLDQVRREIHKSAEDRGKNQ